MDWKIGLDKWLTTPPDDGYSDWWEDFFNNLSDEFLESPISIVEKIEDWVFDSVQCSKWTNKLFDKGFSPKEASQIIERAYKLYYDKERP